MNYSEVSLGDYLILPFIGSIGEKWRDPIDYADSLIHFMENDEYAVEYVELQVIALKLKEAFVISNNNSFNHLFEMNDDLILELSNKYEGEYSGVKVLGKFKDYKGSFGRWYRLNRFSGTAIKKRLDPRDDGCWCRGCRNFIYMAAPDNVQNDGKMSCIDCRENPLRIYY